VKQGFGCASFTTVQFAQWKFLIYYWQPWGILCFKNSLWIQCKKNDMWNIYIAPTRCSYL